MALQTGKLAMVGLGVLGDYPPFVDGIYLRWAFERELGFPWYGFYLFRRPTQEIQSLCLSSVTSDLELEPGPWPDNDLSTAVGRITSDANLVLTDDFAPSGQVELDLNCRHYLRFSLPPDEPVRRIEARIGFREVEEESAQRVCVDFKGRQPGRGPNPRVEQGVRFLVRDRERNPRTHTNIDSWGGTPGLVCGEGRGFPGGLVITLPQPASFVELTLTGSSRPGTVEAFDADGTSVDSARIGNPQGRPQTLRLERGTIERVMVSGALLHEICFKIAQRVCVDFKRRQPGQGPDPQKRLGPNPRMEQGVWFLVRDRAGNLPNLTRVVVRGGALGLDFGFEVDITLPRPVSFVELTLTYSASGGTVAAFDADGTSVDSARIGTPQGTAQTLRLEGEAIERVVVRAPRGETILHEACFGTEAETEIHVTGLLDSMPVTEAVAKGRPGQVVSVRLESDAISAVEVGAGPAALVDLCFIPVSWGAADDWEALEDFPYPLCLPVMHPDYPCNGTPIDLAAAEALALARVRYGPPEEPSADWADAPFRDLHDQLLQLVEGGPASWPMADPARSTPLTPGVPVPPDPGVAPPAMPNQHPLDLVLLSTLHPALAQMVGLYWVDQTADPNRAYDYLIVADHEGKGKGGRDGENMLSLLQQTGFRDVDGYIVFNKRVEPASPLPAPDGLRAYALPGSSMRAQGGGIQDATNNVGLRWNLPVTEEGALLPGQAILYHIWRSDLGNGTAPAAASGSNLVTEKTGPVLVTEPRLGPLQAPQRPDDWPPFALHAIDRGLADGWYGYEVSGIDIFGRHSPNSAAGPWYQWTPVPEPRPWYYQDPPADTIVHPHAVRLLDKTPPPLPTGVEAYALDPDDPTVLRDAAYNAWRTTLSASEPLSASERDTLVGLRVRWMWTEAHMRQAPDTREFRIYYHPGTDLPTPDHSVATHWQERYYVVGYDEHVKERIPATRAPTGEALLGMGATVSGSVVFLNGNPDLSGIRLDVEHLFLEDDTARPNKVYGLMAVDNVAKTVTVAGAPNLGIDPSPWVIGLPQPLRHYEVFLPAPGDTFRAGLPLTPSLADPIVYAHVGVSAADDKADTADAPQWAAGRWGGRFGNEGRVGPPAKIFRVLRTPPSPPEPPPDAERVFATPADYHSRSFYTYRWRPASHLKTHIFRALDDAVFKMDWLIRTTRTTLDPTNAQHEAIFPATWSLHRKQTAASQLKALTSLASYDALSSDAQDILARLPGNEGAPGSSGLHLRDWAIRTSRRSLDAKDPQHAHYFPKDWATLKRQTVATELNAIALFGQVAWVVGRTRTITLDGSPDLAPLRLDRATYWLWLQSDTERSDKRYRITAIDDFAHTVTVDEAPNVPGDTSFWMIDAYLAMSNDALRVLAGLPGNEPAFTQITIQPLDPQEPDPDAPSLLRWRDRVGLDTDPSYIPQPTLRAYEDMVDGRATNRYFYRAAYVDGAHNRSELSLSGPPVYLPNVVPPRAPVITKVLGGDRQITLKWASNREPDLKEYRVYRADSKEAVRDIRLMTPVHTRTVTDPPDLRAAEVEWVDAPVPGKLTLYYCIVAVDASSNVSLPSSVAVARAVDHLPPPPPTWIRVEWVQLDENGAEHALTDTPPQGATWKQAVALNWGTAERSTTLAQRRELTQSTWQQASGWVQPSSFDQTEQMWSYVAYDTGADPATVNVYRLQIESLAGNLGDTFDERRLAPA